MSNILSGKILFLSHKEKQCGVYQFGLNIAEALKKSTKYSFEYVECSKRDEFLSTVAEINPSAIIYNYHPLTLPWLNKRVVQKIKCPHIQIMHEVTQQRADSANASFFQYHIAADPTLLLKNPLVFKTGRLVPKYRNKYALNDIPTIGSFGFGTAGKGFEKLITTVQKEFDKSIIRLHIPFATFGDANGNRAFVIASRCKELIANTDIELFLSHEFLSQEQLLDFLAQNTINAFFYEENKGRGISSVIDYALAVQRPIVITKSYMFRHILSIVPSICIEDSTLKQISNNGIEPLMRYCKEWSEENLIWDYERIIGKILSHSIRPISLVDKAKSLINTAFNNLGEKTLKNFWTPGIEKTTEELPVINRNKPQIISIPGVMSFNRILDNKARDQYRPIINQLFELLPQMMALKIPEANIQQAFVLDTVLKFAQKISLPKILCVGSYHDTAAAGLKRVGFQIDEVDPVLNYDLYTFCQRPSTEKNSYDIIFSTSVLEHVKDDELFITQIAELLAVDGVAILTVDFNDQYKTGDKIPCEDFRMYTQKDLKDRLMPLLKNCSLVDEPKWDSSQPDFVYAGYQYTFATVVFTRNKT